MVIGRARRRLQRALRTASPRVWRPTSLPHPPRALPEFPQVNARSGAIRVRPELSGLRLPRAGVPRRVTRLLIAIAYRWSPSEEYRRRQREMRLMNQWLRHRSRSQRLALPPPVLSYAEENDMAATRLQPMGHASRENGAVGELPRDLTDLEAIERPRRPRLIEPRLRAPDPGNLLTSRPLLPRQYRDFLRHSRYPRAALGAAATVSAIGGFLWVSHIQGAERVAAGRVRVERTALDAQLSAAHRYGVDARDLQRLARRVHMLRIERRPSELIPSGAGLHFYLRQERAYAVLLQEVRSLEREALMKQLVRTLPARAMVMSTERGTLTGYTWGKAAPGTALTVSIAMPIDIVHVEGKRARMDML